LKTHRLSNRRDDGRDAGRAASTLHTQYIAARTTSTSLLLLPLQFSDCLSLSEHQGNGGMVIAVRRANLASTALVFAGAVDAKLFSHVSPFWKPYYCRLQDTWEMKKFGLPNVPRSIYRPGS